MKKEDKTINLEQLKALFGESQAVFLTHYRGLTVAQMNKLRRAMDEVDATYRVAKNTLANLAATGGEYEVIGDDMTGPTGYVFVKGDPAATAKALTKFAKDNDKLIIVSGALGGKKLSESDIQALSKLPSRDEMLSSFLSVLNGPARNFVGVLAAVPRSLVQVLSAIEKEKAA